MKNRSKRLAAVLATPFLFGSLGCGGPTQGRTRSPQPVVATVAPGAVHAPVAGPVVDAGGKPVAWKTAVEPKALTDKVEQGLTWLAQHQVGTGGWGQGDEATGMGSSMNGMRSVANVADTSMALLAFLRAGHTPTTGRHKDAVANGLAFVLQSVEASDKDSLYVTDVRGTRVQGKIGTYVDTFSALMVLTELKGVTTDAALKVRVDAALAKVVTKVEKNQQAGGSWDNRGWAPVLTQSLAAKGLNRAAQTGQAVNAEVLDRVEQQAKAQMAGGGFSADGSAGVELYAGAAASGTLRDSANTRKLKEKDLRIKIATAKTEGERVDAKRHLVAGEATVASADRAQGALIAKLDDAGFIQGFGNNGGEEFLSYMLVSESLVVKGDADWKRWDGSITKLVSAVQNGDGSWTGHHCITGRTFCTAAALLVLMADRTPLPVAVAG